jgi:hypothetical protein
MNAAFRKQLTSKSEFAKHISTRLQHHLRPTAARHRSGLEPSDLKRCFFTSSLAGTPT